MTGTHITVLLDEAVKALNIKKDGLYVDATFGRGGHSKKILESLANGKLLVIDQDPKAIETANEMAAMDSKIVVEHGAFENIAELIEQVFANKVDGILFDLGVSSPQIDEAQRGFSFNYDGPLDMRMNTKSVETAADWLNTADWKEISKVL